MIRSFRDRDTVRLFQRERPRRLPASVVCTAQRKLVMLDAATEVADLRLPPGNRLEKLAGDREGQYSIRINDQWRLCFVWCSGDAYDVEIVDYHLKVDDDGKQTATCASGRGAVEGIPGPAGAEPISAGQGHWRVAAAD